MALAVYRQPLLRKGMGDADGGDVHLSSHLQTLSLVEALLGANEA